VSVAVVHASTVRVARANREASTHEQ
jgi:hypothetical protein